MYVELKIITESTLMIALALRINTLYTLAIPVAAADWRLWSVRCAIMQVLLYATGSAILGCSASRVTRAGYREAVRYIVRVRIDLKALPYGYSYIASPSIRHRLYDVQVAHVRSERGTRGIDR